MRRTTHVITTGVLVAALGLAPRLAAAQTGSTSSGSGTTSESTAGSQATPSGQTGSQPSTTSPSSTTSTQAPTGTTQSGSTASQSSGGVDPAAARQHLANARQALADLTKLPAATTLQGDQRTAITNFIQAFNAFATAQNDWKSKFEVVDQQLDQILATAGAGGPSADASTGTTGSTSTSPSGAGTPSTSSTSSTGAAAGSTGTGGAAASAASGGYDPAIVDKLKTMRTELDAFLLATGDPEPHIKAIEKILNGGNAAGAGSVGTSGSTGASAGGSVTLTPDQVSEIRSHLDSMRQAANK